MQAALNSNPDMVADFSTAHLVGEEAIWRLSEEVEAEVWTDMVEGAPAQFRDAIGLRIERIGSTTVISSARADAAEFNRAFGTGVNAHVDDAELSSVVSHFAGSPLKSPRFQLYPRPVDPDLKPRLEGFGLKPSGRCWAKFVRGSEPAESSRTSFIVEDVTATEPETYARVVVKGFGMPDVLAVWLTALAGRPGWRLYVARDNGAAVGGAALYLGKGWSWFGIGAVLPEARGRGAQRALMERRITDSLAAGCRMMFTETGKPQTGEPAPSYSNIGRSGFGEMYERANYFFPATAA